MIGRESDGLAIMVKNEVDMDIGPRSTSSGYRNEVFIGGPACPADTPTTWAADQSGRGILYYERELTVIEFHMGNADRGYYLRHAASGSHGPQVLG